MQDMYMQLRAFYLFSLIATLILLIVQAIAWDRHRKRCFRLLVCSSILALLYLVVSATPYFVQVSENAYRTVFHVSVVLAVLASIISIWGTVELFSSYRQLAEVAKRLGDLGYLD